MWHGLSHWSSNTGYRLLAECAVSLLLACGMYYLFYEPARALEIALGVFAIWIGFWFFRIHALSLGVAVAQMNNLSAVSEKQNTQLEDISAIGRKLETSSIVRKNIKKLLPDFDVDGKKYQCVIPVQYIRRPLPLIAAGDYFALHVMQSCMNTDEQPEDLPILPVDRSVAYWRATSHPEFQVDGNAIFLCNPLANPALSVLFPAVEYDGYGVANIPWKSKFEGVHLPFWFGFERSPLSLGAAPIHHCPPDEEPFWHTKGIFFLTVIRRRFHRSLKRHTKMQRWLTNPIPSQVLIWDLTCLHQTPRNITTDACSTMLIWVL